MDKIVVAILGTLFMVTPALSSDKSDPMAAVHQFIDGFNKGDVKSALAACAEETSIIDDFPPHEWHGPGACSAWSKDFDADAERTGITDEVVVLMNPRHVDVTGDRAYVVVPANYTYKLKGKPISEMGSIFTLALHKEASGWRITAWSWAKR
ncbi:MAG: nuclear transport factor 2 family protein [Burkholderiaceae bacterium]|jgi:ketosteroid isomerase-like protein